jgi:hypothetical protein
MSGGHNSEYAVQLTVGKQSRDCEVVVEALLPTAGGSQTARFRVVVASTSGATSLRGRSSTAMAASASSMSTAACRTSG